MGLENILITSALLYANGPLHFGHMAGAYLPADCYARYMRFKGHPVLFLSGSDEYGAAITLSAEKAHRTPKEHVDDFHAKAQKAFSLFDISFDHYARTTWPGHEKTVLEFYEDLNKNGYLEKKVTEQLYSEKDQKFLADRYVVGTCPECGFEEARGDECPKCGASYETSSLKNPRSKLSGSKLVLKKTEHTFIRLDLLKQPLKKWITPKKWKSQVINMALQYIDNAQPRSITRDLDWGVAVPGEEGKVFYVWFDAPIGYISAAREWAELKGEKEAWKDFWLNESARYIQFVGKDNIPFHSVFFPAMQLGQDTPYKMVDELPANAFFHYEGKKFSKSDGWFIDLEDFFSKYDSDCIRYTLAANAPENQDSEFSWKDFQSKINADLVGKFGNFVNRVMVFIAQKCDKKMPVMGQKNPRDEILFVELARLSKELESAYEHFHLREATQKLMQIASLGNIYFDEMQPWKLIKGDSQRLETVLRCCLEVVKALAVFSYPILPKSAEKIWQMLGQEQKLTGHTLHAQLTCDLNEHSYISKPVILFTKMDDKQVSQELEKLHQPEKVKEDALLSFDQFLKMDLRVAEILEVNEVPKSKKLYKLKVDLGEEQRQVVSGIKMHFSPEELVGKKIILVANLKPAKIMGIESHGMILAASTSSQLELPQVQHLAPGSKVS